jgi:hypothetical protein
MILIKGSNMQLYTNTNKIDDATEWLNDRIDR